eukprot:9902584-Ditylum_brightwellii.AAC.1
MEDMLLVFPQRLDGWISNPEEENFEQTDLGGNFQQFLSFKRQEPLIERHAVAVSGDLYHQV